MSTIRTALSAAASVLAAAALSATVGLVTMPAHATPQGDPFQTSPTLGLVRTTAPSQVPAGHWTPVTRDQAYAAYVEAYGENNGCREDFDLAYQGTRFIDDLDPAAAADLREQQATLTPDEGLAMTDYENSLLIEVRDDEVVVIGEYVDGTC